MNKVLAFFLGMLFGIIFILGALGLGIYIALTVVTPTTIAPDSATYLGSLADMSLLDIANSLRDLYAQEAGIADENGRYFSVAEFLEYYRIDPSTAFGLELPEAVLEIPVFELFSDGGFAKVSQQVKVSSVVALLGSFNNGDGASNDVKEELSKYSLADLFDSEKGIQVVFQNVSMSDIMPDAFPAEDSDNKIMWAIGQAKIGELYSAMSGTDSLFLQFKEGGSFEALGAMPVTELLGGNTGAMGNLLGQSTLSDMIDENGSINVDGVVANMYLGTVLSCMRNEILHIDTYKVNTALSNKDATLYEKTTNGTTVYAKEEDGYYYQADLFCREDHAHDIYCYKYVWYNQSTHTGELPDDYVDADGRHARITGIYTAFVNRKLAEMMTGSSESLLADILKMKIGELYTGEMSGLMENFADMSIQELLNGGIDSLYLGSLLSFNRTKTDAPAFPEILTDGENTAGYVGKIGTQYALSDNSQTWFLAKMICNETHTHTRKCYSYVWLNGENEATGIMGKFADFKISQLNNVDDALSTLTLRDVLGDNSVDSGIFSALADIPIGELADEIDKIYLGDVISCMRHEIDDKTGYTAMSLSTSNRQLWQKQVDNEIVYAREEDGILYEAALLCNNKNIRHVHTANCYNYVWYNALGHGTPNEGDLMFDDDGLYHSPITGLYKAFVNVKLEEMNGGSSAIMIEEIKKLTVGDLMGDNVYGIMSELSSMSVGDLMGGGVEDVYLGTFFTYKRNPYNDALGNIVSLGDGEGDYTYISNVGGNWYMSENGTEWYEARLVCSEEHSHSARNCYTYVWYRSCSNNACTNPTHKLIDGEPYNEAEGMMFKLSDEKIEDLRHLNSIIQNYTLGDVMGDNLSGMLGELKDTPLGSISTAVNNIYLGTAVNDYRKEIAANNIAALYPILTDKNGADNVQVRSNGLRFVKTDDGKKWYEAELDCNVSTHTSPDLHTESCYVYVWYTDEACTAPVTGITKAFVNSKLNNVNETLTANVKKLTLEDIGIDCNGNKILTSLRNVPLSEISGEINDLKLGVVLGYTKKQHSVPVGYTAFLYNDGNNDYVLHSDGKYYHAKLNCKNSAHTSATHHTASCYEYVWYESLNPDVVAKGINAKMSNTSINDLGNGGLTGVVQDMSVGDLIDSGMLTLTEENEYKLDIIFDDTNVTPHCTLAGYTAYCYAHPGATAKDYYNSVHQGDNSHRGAWKELRLQSFISALLNAI